MHVWPYLAAIVVATPSFGAHAEAARVWHVRPPPLGDDATGNGSAERPWATLPHAFAQLRAGDTLVLGGGHYPLAAPLTVPVGGTAARPLVIRAAAGEVPVLDGLAWVPGPELARSRGNTGLLHVEGPSHVRIEGVRVIHSRTAGIFVRGPSEHIDIVGCATRFTFGPGIAAWNAAHLRVRHCDVSRANDRSMNLPGDERRRENPHEAISIAGVAHFEVAWCRVHDSIKEGIDVKEVSRHGVVHHNHVFAIHRQGLYADAWFGLLEDVTFHHNVVHDSEWGIVISVEGRNSHLRSVRVHDNLLFRLRASGVYFGRWGGDGPREDIVVAHNTIWQAGHPEHWSGATGGIDLRSPNARDVIVKNNLVVEGGGYALATIFNPAADPTALANRGYQLRRNLLWPVRDETDRLATHPYGRPYPVNGYEAIVADPGFVDPAAGDFRLAPDSPARGVAVPLELPRRPANAPADLGADPAVLEVPRRVWEGLWPAGRVAPEPDPAPFAPDTTPADA